MLSCMKRFTRTTAVLIATAVVISLVGQRLVGAEFSPAAAHEPTSGAEAALLNGPNVADPAATDAPATVPVTAADPTAATVITPVAASPRPAAPQPTAPPAPARTSAPTAPPAPTLAPTTAPATCPANWFCYPRLGIAGAIVPYTDCSGSTDVGTSIRSFLCLSPFYLMGHAYTQFGKITQWQAGDIVFASGRQFTITGAFTQSSCEAPARAIAPLSLQTSLTSGGCGSVLVVQGN